MKLNRAIFLAITVLIVASCAKKEEILQGQRFGVRTPLDQTYPDKGKKNALADTSIAATAISGPVAVSRSLPLRLPKQVNAASWTASNGGPSHRLENVALGRGLTRLWSVDIGTGNERKYRLTASPVVAGGLIFTLDSQSRVMAHSPIGAEVWSQSLTPPSDKTADASGGGLAYAKGVVYATTGFGEVTALRARDGKVLWVQKLDAPVVAAPMVDNGRVYVVSRDNRAWSIKTRNGRIDWQQQSAPAVVGLFGGASPASAGRLVILPFSSGEVIAALARNGLRVWSVAISGARPGLARANIEDITSEPVVTASRVYAANQSGRITAVDRTNGKRIWTADQGSYSPVWPVAGSVFMISDEAQLIRLDAATGKIIWAVDLPAYKKAKKRKGAYAHFGPIMAGGRLIVASSDGALRSFDPVNGDLLSTVDIPSGAASQPAIVDGVLYVLSQNGKLNAYK